MTGDRSTERLLQENWRVDPSKAGRLVAEAEDLAPRLSLHGQPLPPRLPCTATVLASGEISPEHVAIIRRTMTKIDKMEHVDPAEVPAADAYLAEKATLFPPAILRRLADALLRRLDPDGAAPDEDADLFDDLKMTSGPDGTLEMRIRIHDAVDAETIREGIGVLATPTGADDHRSLGNRQACALKEVFADALGPNGLVTDTRQNEHERRRAAADDEAGADERARGLEDALIPEPRRPEPEPAAPGAHARAGAGVADDHDGSPLAAAGDRARHAGLRCPVRPGHRPPVGLRRRHRADGAGLEVRTARHRAPLPADPRRDAPGAELPRRRLRVPRLHPPTAALPRPPHRALGRRRPDLPSTTSPCCADITTR